MADIADDANNIAQLEIASILNSRIPEKASYYKVCRNCHEPTPDGNAFCDKDCCDDFDRRNKREV